MKKFITFLVLGAYLFAGSLFAKNPEIPNDNVGNLDSYVRGDVDGDGTVTREDVMLIYRAANRLLDLSKNKAVFERADFNGDGKITFADAQAAMRVLAELEPASTVPAPEDPVCLPDPDGRGLNNIPDEDLDKVITSIATPFGAIAIFSDDRVAICRGKKIMLCWDEETTENDILFDANTVCSNPERRWCGVVNNRIFYFTNELMALVVDDVCYYDYTGSEWFCYRVANNALDVWSPSTALVRVARRVTDSLFYCGYLFYEIDGDYVYVLNADPYRIAKMSQEYVDAHPLKGIRLGDANLINYADRLGDDPNVIDYQKREAFNKAFYIDWSIWGHPKSSIEVDDFVEYSDFSYDDVYARFDVPSVKTVKDPLHDVEESARFEHVSLNGIDGSLSISSKYDMLDTIKWTSYESTKAVYDRQLAYLKSFGSESEARYPKQGYVEQDVDIRGLTMIAGYDSNAGSESVYVLVPYQ